MSVVYEIKLNAHPEKFSVTLGAKTYVMRTHYANAPEAGWLLDISDDSETPLACGIPFVTGVDLLGQLEYLAIGGILFTLTSGAPAKVPTFENLGVESHLYFEA